MKKNKRIKIEHPGVILKEEFLKPLGISAYRLSKEIGVSQVRTSEIIRGIRRISADTGLRLSKYFNMSESYWIDMQAHYDMRKTRDEIANEIKKIKALKMAS